MSGEEQVRKPGQCVKRGCQKPGKRRYSMDIYAGCWCDEHWQQTSYIKADKEAFDPDYAGERYEPEE